MKPRYRLVHRGCREKFYCVDTATGRRTSLRTSDLQDARGMIHAKNETVRVPMLNLQLAKTYLAGTHSQLATRTWREAIEDIIASKQGSNQERWQTFLRDKALSALLPLVIVETDGGVLLKVLSQGTASTNVYLRRTHNFCLDMNWLLAPIIPKRQWPVVTTKPTRAITREEHEKIVAGELNAEWKAFYQLSWHLGASQVDIANLQGEEVDWTSRTLNFARKKTGVAAHVHLGTAALAILSALPRSGLLFPHLAGLRSSDRANRFKDICRRAGVEGVTLHSYRYAWAERAKTAGYPERFAQEALGHGSKAVHRAYARKAQVLLPSLEEYEKKTTPIS